VDDHAQTGREVGLHRENKSFEKVTFWIKKTESSKKNLTDRRAFHKINFCFS
jgi:hypothetical protein